MVFESLKEFLIEKEKEGLFLIRAMIDETCHQGRVTFCNRKKENPKIVIYSYNFKNKEWVIN